MDQQTISTLRKKLDATVLSMAEMIKRDIYDNVIVSTVRDWFEGNDSILTLNNNIKTNVENRWPFLQKKIGAQLLDFEEQTKATISTSDGLKSQELDMKAVSEGVSQSISIAIGALGSAFVGMICGGAGTALIASGPVGWVIGAIGGAFAYFLGKTAFEEVISDYIVDKRIPALVKKPAKGKIVAQLKLNESKFEQEIYEMLEQYLKPIYEAIDNDLSKQI